MWHSQILASWNFSSNLDFVPWIGEKLHIEAEFQQFSRINKYIRGPGNFSEICSNVWFFSNPGDQVLKCKKKKRGDKSVPYFYKKTNNVPWIGEQWDIAIFSDSFPCTLTYLLVLGNCWNSALMLSLSPIQGKMSRLLLKLNVARIWEYHIYKNYFCHLPPIVILVVSLTYSFGKWYFFIIIYTTFFFFFSPHNTVYS